MYINLAIPNFTFNICENNVIPRFGLKDDEYYSNIVFNTNSNIKRIESANTYITRNDYHFYPLTNSLAGTQNEAPLSFSRQTYDLFMYDKDINNYALLLYGIRLEYSLFEYNSLYVLFEIKI